MRNLTISLDPEAIRQVKAIAARQGLSVSALMRKQITELVDKDTAYQKAQHSALARLNKKSKASGFRKISREDLHDRGAGHRTLH